MCTPTRIVVCSTILLAAGASAQITQDLGSLGTTRNFATALSGDGAVVVGYSHMATNQQTYAFRWATATAMQDLGNLGGPGPRSYAYGVSADGDTVVGTSTVPSGDTHAFRWVAGVGMQDLGTLGGAYSYAFDVSEDGQVIVGYATVASGYEHAFRWTQATGMVDLGNLGWDSAIAYGVSGDGAVVVGQYGDRWGLAFRAFRWTAAGGMIDLGTLGGFETRARAVSSDGSVIIGTATDPSHDRRGFRWSPAGGIQQLDDLGGQFAEAYDVDSAGIVVVGVSETASGQFRGYRWTAATGAVELPGFSGLQNPARGVSADGGAAAGYGTGPGLPDAHAIRWRWSTLGNAYCNAEHNSTGGPATLSAYGTLDVARRDLALRADGLPLASWAFALSSRDAGLVFPLPGSQGRLCLGGAFGRHNGAGDVLNTGLGSSLAWALDPAAFPSPSGPVAVQPGETWRFQVWYRDANPGSTSNLTDAVAVTFQ